MKAKQSTSQTHNSLLNQKHSPRCLLTALLCCSLKGDTQLKQQREGYAEFHGGSSTR